MNKAVYLSVISIIDKINRFLSLGNFERIQVLGILKASVGAVILKCDITRGLKFSSSFKPNVP